jgi:hypothetical protein
MMWVIFMKVGSVLSLYLSEGQENEELFFLAMFPHCYSGDKIKNELGWACGMWRSGEVHTGFWWGKLRQTAYLEDIDVGGR